MLLYQPDLVYYECLILLISYGGTIIPLQGAAITTTAARLTPFRLIVALTGEGFAIGDLFVDDGVQVEANIPLNHLFVTYEARNSSLVGEVRNNTYAEASNMRMGEVNILGLKCAPVFATLNGLDITHCMSYNSTSQELVFALASLPPSLSLAVNQNFNLQWFSSAPVISTSGDSDSWIEAHGAVLFGVLGAGAMLAVGYWCYQRKSSPRNPPVAVVGEKSEFSYSPLTGRP